jgi:hypothetical protein
VPSIVKNRRPDLVELDPAVVDAGQTALVLAVRRRNAGQVVAVVVADGHHEAVHAVALTFGDQLGEDGSDAGGVRRPADVVLARRRRGGVDDELLGLGVVGRGGLQGLHVTAVAGLGHREATQQFQVDQLLDVRLMVAVGAEVLDRAAEEAPLNAGLHHQRQIRHRQHLDLGDGSADVAVAAMLLLEAVLGGPVGGHDPHLLVDLRAGNDGVRRVMRFEDLGGEFLSHPVLHVSPAAVEGIADVIGGGRHISTVSRESGRETVMWQTQAILSRSAETDEG